MISEQELKEIRDTIIIKIVTERNRQDAKWGRYAGLWDDSDQLKLTVVMEEIGEIAKAILEDDSINLYEEIIQSMAVLMAWAEVIEHGDF